MYLYQWNSSRLILWISWFDDCLVTWNKKNVLYAKSEMMSRFDCDESGVLNEYIRCKLDWNREQRTIKLTQPVLLQSLKDEFDITKGQKPATPAEPGSILTMEKDAQIMKESDQKTYLSGIGMLLHMMKWSRPEISNAARELSK